MQNTRRKYDDAYCRRHEPDLIKYALLTLANNTTRVKDMKQYMLAILYNAPTTISSYYQNWVQHDMAKEKDV